MQDLSERDARGCERHDRDDWPGTGPGWDTALLGVSVTVGFEGSAVHRDGVGRQSGPAVTSSGRDRTTLAQPQFSARRDLRRRASASAPRACASPPALRHYGVRERSRLVALAAGARHHTLMTLRLRPSVYAPIGSPRSSRSRRGTRARENYEAVSTTSLRCTLQGTHPADRQHHRAVAGRHPTRRAFNMGYFDARQRWPESRPP